MWPTINMCTRHGRALAQVKDELLNRFSADFFLAHELDSTCVVQSQDTTSCQQALLSNIASWTTSLVNQTSICLDESALRYTYLLGAKQKNWLALNGSIRLQAIQESFVSQYSVLASFPEFEFVQDANKVNGGFLGCLFRKHQGRHHPSKHFVLMSFLFPEPESFFSTYASVEAVVANDGPLGPQKLLTQTSQRLVSLVEEAGHSVGAAAEILNIPEGEALAHMNRRPDVERAQRPHIAGTEREELLRVLLSKGESRRYIAEKLSLRLAFIQEYLMQHPELKAQWDSAQSVKKTEYRRAQLIEVLRAHPGMPIKAIQRMPQAGFQWLYNNDKKWLQEVLPAIWKSN